jgi:hypothetical protein
MPSLLHEGLLELIRDRPDFVARLLRELLHVEVPQFTEARLADSTLTDLVPTEYRADAVVLFVDGRPVFGCIVEAQLSEDKDKAFSWPMYAVAARARYRCPFVLIVVAPEDGVARWATRPISLGGGQAWSPFVLGPQGIPVITDPVAAVAEPELAVLSALAHARAESETALAVARAAVLALGSIPAEQQVLYFHLLRTAVSNAARKAFEMLPSRLEKYLPEEDRQRMRAERNEGRSEGRSEGLREGLQLAVVKVVESRGLALSDDLRERLRAKTEQELTEILGRAVLVQRPQDLFD